MNLDNFKSIYFIGIGGIGMSALAHYFVNQGAKVSGYDRSKTELTIELEKVGIEISYDENIDSLKDLQNIQLVIFTPAIDSKNIYFEYFKKSQVPLLKRSQILGEITKPLDTIAVAGTHGKTTTSSIIAHILTSDNKDGLCFIGGITSNYKSNFLTGKGNFSVVEADEYDRSFMNLFPDTIVLTSMDADHLDIYENKDFLVEAFKDFTNLLSDNKKLIVEENISHFFKENLSYGFKKDNDLQIINVQIKEGLYLFDIVFNNQTYQNFVFKMPGSYNLLNAAGSILACLINGITVDSIKNGLQSYSGVKRRFDVQLSLPKLIYIDDYAHHPKEIDSLLSAVKSFYPQKFVVGVFQPHLFSRTRDFMDYFAESLSGFDQIFLLPIYPAREAPIEGIDSSVLIQKIKNNNKRIINSVSELFNFINRDLDMVLLTIGAGDIDQWPKQIKKIALNA
ncbi:UDP-N-acetylmuramate--L-alanine ligase [Flavobacteriales bacterium]|nr:UDP-N-acetylmuramate--L-alanine ligase [Flavobacteriales bacterium]